MKAPLLRPIIYSCCMATILSSCASGDVRETLGINSAAPDEFVVVSRPPLSVPPEFDLKPPEPDAPKVSQVPTEEKARQAVLSGRVDTSVESVSSEALSSSAEATFLGKLKVEDADPTIRRKLGQDETAERDSSGAKSLLEKLSIEEDEQPLVDPKKEAQRIRDNKDNARPVNEGDVQTVKPGSGSLFEKLF